MRPMAPGQEQASRGQGTGKTGLVEKEQGREPGHETGKLVGSELLTYGRIWILLREQGTARKKCKPGAQ